MKNILFLLISSILFINCGGSDDDNSSSQTFLEKFNGTFWEVEAADHNFIGDYFGFSSGSLFLQIVEIEELNNNELICVKLHEGDNFDGYENYNVEITKNTSNELWVKVGTSILKFLVKSGDNEMIVSHFMDGTFESQETYQLTDLSYDYFCN